MRTPHIPHVVGLAAAGTFPDTFAGAGPRLLHTLASWMPPRLQEVFITVTEITMAKTGGYVVSKIVLAAASAFFHGVFFAAIGVPYWLALALFAGITMVTNVPFYSFKDVNFRKSVPFIVVFLIALALALLAIDPPKVLWPLFVVYGLSGYAVFAWRLAKGKPVSIIQTEEEPLDPSERR